MLAHTIAEAIQGRWVVYDYIVVGGGSAGCVLAARLSEDADVRVLLLEAGVADRHPLIHIPAGYFRLATDRLTWGFRTAPQRHAGNRAMPLAQARLLGGGSSINAEVFARGAPEDYDRWAGEEGCAGWSFAEVSRVFVRMEDNDLHAGPYHGNGGPLGVSTPAAQPLTRVFVQACQQAGIPHTADFNGLAQEGAGVYQTTTRRGRRCSAAVAYLDPARGRPNLEIRTGCLARRVIVERGRAAAVEFEQNGQFYSLRAEREIVLAAGGIGSPRLLLQSGIGPAGHLRDVGVPVVHDLPGVGQNLQDHYAIDVIHELTGPWSLDRYQRRPWMLLAGLRYALFGDGPATSTVVEGGAFWRVDPASAYADTQLHFVAGAGIPPGVAPLPSRSGCMLNAYLLRPLSRGTVTLRSSDPRVAPVIDPNYLAEPYDLRMAVASVRLMREIMAQPAFSRLVKREHLPGAGESSTPALERFVQQYGRTGYHPSGACKMGVDAAAVVAPDLRVHGIAGLRVCDSSIMPSIVSSSTNVPSMMIGEYASDLIRGRATLPCPAETGAQVGAREAVLA